MDNEQTTAIENIDDMFFPFADEVGFLPDELRLNQDWRLSGRQRRMLWFRYWGTVIIGLLSFILPIGIAAGLLAWAESMPFGDALFDLRTQTGYIAAIILSIMYNLANYRRLLLGWDLMHGRIRTIRGGAQIIGSYLKIGDYRFVMPPEALEVLQPGMVYRIYLLPASGTLLSLEFAE